MKYNMTIINGISTLLKYLAIDTNNRVKLSTGYTLKMDECGNLMYVCWREVGVESNHEICANELSYSNLYDEVEKISEENMKKYTEEVKLHESISRVLQPNNRRNK